MTIDVLFVEFGLFLGFDVGRQFDSKKKAANS